MLLLIIITMLSQVQGQFTITNAAIQPDTRSTPQLADRGNLMLVIEGITTGAKATSVTWRRNDSIVNRNTRVGNTFPFYDGGGEDIVGTGPCESRMYRVALLVNGYLPGSYTYTVNYNSPNAVTSPVFNIEDSGPPTNIVLRQINNMRVLATWTSPAGFPNATYRVYLNTLDVINDGAPVTGTYYMSNSFSPDFTVTLRIRATTGTYLSVPALSSTLTVRENAVLPPTISVLSVNATFVTLSFSQPMGSLLVDIYNVTLTSTTCHKLTGSVMSMTNLITIGNLEAGIQYFVNVTATNNAHTDGGGFNSNTTTWTTTETAPSGSPGVPTAGVIMSTNITLTWTEIDCLDRNGVITSYTIQYGEGTTRDRTINTQSSATTHLITSLNPFTQYTFTVAGVNSVGTGPYSGTNETIRTAEGIPTVIRHLILKRSYFSIMLKWDVPDILNGIISHYNIQYSVNGLNLSQRTNITSFSIVNLDPNTTVSNVTVSATTGGGQGPPSQAIEISTLESLAVVFGVMAEVQSNFSVIISWNKTGFDSNTHFVIYYRLNNTTNNTEMNETVSFSRNSVVIYNLDKYRSYSFEVAARVSDNRREIIGTRSAPVTVMVITRTLVTTVILPQTASMEITPSNGTALAAIAGGVAAAIVLLTALIVLVILLLWLYRRNRLCFHSSNSKAKLILKYQKGHQVEFTQTDISPHIEEFPENTTAIEGEEVIFKVMVSGKPTPTLTWKRGEKELYSNYSMTVGDDGTLTLPSTEMDQSGVYVLEARNSAGKAQREVKLEVQKEFENNPAITSTKKTTNVTFIPADQFGEYVAEKHSSNNLGFREQFQGLYDGEGKSKTVGLSPEFKKLNRFANITVYDDNRIELSPIIGHENCQGTFINACYIDGYSKAKKFIASQGPLPKTLVDFWRLIWQERPPIIVMVTNLKEGNKKKCQQYWPDSGSVTYNPFKVTITESLVLADFIVRNLQIKLEGNNRPFKLTQFHFTAWPDHGVPDYASPMLAFHRRVITTHKGKKGPILVHCSAGVGHTGTFICIDNILEQIKKENAINIAAIITKMRHQRMKMVQTVDQYVFLHDAILEYKRCGDTEISASNLRVVLNTYGKRDPHTGATIYQSQFDVLDQVSPKINEVVCTTAAKNPEKNRSTKYLPSDRFRVILRGVTEDYIHAVFAHGYKQHKAYIIAENPMTATVQNILKVIHDRKIGAVVMLSTLEENGQKVCARYWPDLNQVTKINEYEIDLISEEILTGFTIRNISILHEKSQKAHLVMQFHITCWQPDGQCSNLRSVVDTIEEVAKVQRKTGNKPVFVHCSDTVTRSGMFCALATIIDRCKTEGIVDVFQVVKALRIQKPGAVPTVQNYRIIFEALLMFLDSFDTYSNFQN